MNVGSTVALFVAPAAATGFLFFSDLARGRLGGFPVITVLGFGVIAYLVATVVTVALGIPAFSFLRRFNLVRWWSALASGAAISFLVALAFGAAFRDGVATTVYVRRRRILSNYLLAHRAPGHAALRSLTTP